MPPPTLQPSPAPPPEPQGRCTRSPTTGNTERKVQKPKVPEEPQAERPEDGTGRREETAAGWRENEGRKEERRQEAGGGGLPAVPLPWWTVAFVSICPSLSLSHPPASAAARQTQPFCLRNCGRFNSQHHSGTPGHPSVSPCLCPPVSPLRPPPFTTSLDWTDWTAQAHTPLHPLPPSFSWVFSFSASSVASEAGRFRIWAGGVPGDTKGLGA